MLQINQVIIKNYLLKELINKTTNMTRQVSVLDSFLHSMKS